MVSSAADVGELSVGDGMRAGKITRVSCNIRNNIDSRQSRDVHAKLMCVNATPHKQVALSSYSSTVVLPRGDLDDVVFREVLNNGGDWDDGRVLTGFRRVEDTALAELIETPRPDTAVLGDSEGVVRASGHILDLLARQAKFTGDEPVHAGTLDDATAKLELLPIAPGVDGTFGREREDVVITNRDINDVFNGLHHDRSWLNTNLGGKAEDAISTLEEELITAKIWREVKEDLLEMFPRRKLCPGR